MTIPAPSGAADDLVLIDTSAWVEYLRATGSPQHKAVRAAVESDRAVTTDPVMLEILVGTTHEDRAAELLRMLESCHYRPQDPRGDIEAAAAIFRACRRAGETPRALTDCLIAAIAVRTDLPLLHCDADFDVIARQVPLRRPTH